MMRQSTSNRPVRGGVGSLPNPLAVKTGGWSTGAAELRQGTAPWSAEATAKRIWIIAAGGLGALACIVLAAAAVRTFSAASPEEACSTAADCNELGVVHARDANTESKELTVAARLFQRACDQGHAAACNNLGLAYQRARGVPLDPARAMSLFEQACSDGFGEACNNQGALYENGLGVARNMGDAQRLYSQACRRGSALGCSNLGVLYAQGRSVATDESAAARLFAEACRAGSAVGCSNLLESELPTPLDQRPQ